ncbi:MAG: DHH family phosphoesterase [Actinomycetota bacterium]|nr:DHH family phosphoesterase [Actinomycetota bacterium]
MSEHRSEAEERSAHGGSPGAPSGTVPHLSPLDEAAAAIASAPSLALACHHTPDGDALGSMLALHLLALAAGKQSVASWPEPFPVAPHYTFLPGLELATKPADYPTHPELMVTFDCGSLGRLAELGQAARNARRLIVIDHHSTNDGYGTINLIDPDAAASAVVVRRLLDRLGWALTRDAAECLYTGLICDTGRFQYDNTTPEVFTLARELAAFGLPIGPMNRQLFEEHRLAYLRLAGAALQRAVYDGDRRFVATWITAADLAQYGVGLDETEGLIDLVRRTVEADVSCVLKETPDGTKVSLRAVNGFDVGQVATGFGGGGHKAAAGFVDPRPVAELLAAIRDALPRVATD